jgi:TfoX/Sxy family transcriptional regulator of competence genes
MWKNFLAATSLDRMAYDESTAERVRRLLAGRRDVVEKKMMGGLSFMVGGNMACSISGKGGMLIRVGPEAMDDVAKQPHAQVAKMGAMVMTGFIRVDPEGYRTDAALKKWVARGVDFAASLPAKKSKSASQKK